jgi:hypothetical protein
VLEAAAANPMVYHLHDGIEAGTVSPFESDRRVKYTERAGALLAPIFRGLLRSAVAGGSGFLALHFHFVHDFLDVGHAFGNLLDGRALIL